MDNIGVVQLDEADFSELIEVCYVTCNRGKPRILQAIGHVTGSDYTNIVGHYARYLNKVEELIESEASRAYESFCERDRY